MAGWASPSPEMLVNGKSVPGMACASLREAQAVERLAVVHCTGGKDCGRGGLGGLNCAVCFWKGV